MSNEKQGFAPANRMSRIQQIPSDLSIRHNCTGGMWDLHF